MKTNPNQPRLTDLLIVTNTRNCQSSMWQGEIWSELKWTGIGEHASLADINIIHSIINISLFLNGSNPLAYSSWQVSIDQIWKTFAISVKWGQIDSQ